MAAGIVGKLSAAAALSAKNRSNSDDDTKSSRTSDPLALFSDVEDVL